MDYGDDYPPAPTPAHPAVDWRAVSRRAINIIVTYMLIAAAGLITLAARDAITSGAIRLHVPAQSVHCPRGNPC